MSISSLQFAHKDAHTDERWEQGRRALPTYYASSFLRRTSCSHSIELTDTRQSQRPCMLISIPMTTSILWGEIRFKFLELYRGGVRDGRCWCGGSRDRCRDAKPKLIRCLPVPAQAYQLKLHIHPRNQNPYPSSSVAVLVVSRAKRSRQRTAVRRPAMARARTAVALWCCTAASA